MKIRKMLLLCVGALMLFVLAGCGSSEEEGEPKTLEEVYTEMTEVGGLPAMIRMEDDYVANYYGADLNTFSEYVFASAEDALLAENIIMVKLADGEKPDAIVKLLESIIKQKKVELETYLPEQYKIVEKSEVVTSGSYVYLIISSKKDELDKLAKKYLK